MLIVFLIGVISKEIVFDDGSIYYKTRYREKLDKDMERLNLGVAYPANFIIEAIYDVLAQLEQGG